MSNLTQNLVNPNTQPLVIGEFSIRQDEDGRYCLNDLHKASGNDKKHQPAYFIRNKQTQDLIEVIEAENDDLQICRSKKAVSSIKGRSLEQGTFVVKELVYYYAMWISAKFHLTVIRAYDAMVMQWKINDRQSISPEQQALLHEIVDRRSQGNRKIYAEMWSRHNRHFKIPRYAELLAIHFSEAVHYLETMELKAAKKQEANGVNKPNDETSAKALALHMLWLHQWWDTFGPAMRSLSPKMASSIHDHFIDGASFAYHFVDRPTVLRVQEKSKQHAWHLNFIEQLAIE